MGTIYTQFRKMKTLQESILDIDKNMDDTDIIVKRQQLLIPELRKESFGREEMEVEGSELKFTKTRGIIWVSDGAKFFDILKKYKITKVSTNIKTEISFTSEYIIEDIEMSCGTTLEMSYGRGDLKMHNVKIFVGLELTLSCGGKLEVTNSDIDCRCISLMGIKNKKFNFRGSRFLNTMSLFVCSSDPQYLQLLDKMDVTATYAIQWAATWSDKKYDDPLDVFGFNPRQWPNVKKFVIQASVAELFGIKTGNYYQFGWSRGGADLARCFASDYTKNKFKNWDNFKLMKGKHLSWSF